MSRISSFAAPHTKPAWSGPETDIASDAVRWAAEEDETTPPRSQGVPASFRGTRRVPPTREEEIELAKRIEAANRRLVQAILRSPPARDALAALAKDVRNGIVDAEQLTGAVVSEPEDEQPAERILEAVEGAEPSEDPATTILRYGLGPNAVARILARLTELRALGSGSPARLDKTIRRVRETQQAAERAKAIFVEANMGLVFWMAQKRGTTLLPLSDLVQEGTLGLMRAVQKFDWRRGARFNTYAVWWIRHAINRALSDQSRIIRIPVHQLENRHRLARVTQEFRTQHGRDPALAELAESTGLSEERIRAASTVSPEPVSLDAPIRDGGEMTLEHVVADPKDTSVVDDISTRQVGIRLRALLSALPARDQEVLRLRFGMDGSEPLTLQQIGTRLSISRERVRQIESDALRRLRIPAATQRLDAHLLH